MVMLLKKKSPIHGFGIFTTVNIKLGEVFYKIPTTEIFNSPKNRRAHLNGKWIYDNVVLNWVNHSCNPNTKLDDDPLALVAIRDIKEGEEITCDYNRTETGGKKVPCNCRNSCRKYFMRKE